MYTMEDLKTNRDAQITVASILFFVLAFPIYFSIAAGNADTDFAGAAGDYQVSGELTYVVLDSGSESIADGDTWSMTYNTDAVNDADELNIVGVRISMSYGEDETANGVGCAQHPVVVILLPTPSRALPPTSRSTPLVMAKTMEETERMMFQRFGTTSPCSGPTYLGYL